MLSIMSYKGPAFNCATLPLGMDFVKSVGTERSSASGSVSNSAVCRSSKPHKGVLVVYKYEDEFLRSLQRSVDGKTKEARMNTGRVCRKMHLISTVISTKGLCCATRRSWFCNYYEIEKNIGLSAILKTVTVAKTPRLSLPQPVMHKKPPEVLNFRLIPIWSIDLY